MFHLKICSSINLLDISPYLRYSSGFQSSRMLGAIRTTLVLFSLPLFVSQEVEDDSRVISVALVDDKFEVLSGSVVILLALRHSCSFIF